MNLSIKRISILFVLAVPLLILSGCGEQAAPEEKPKASARVEVQAVKDSRSVRQELQFPGIVAADQEANITAKVAGNVKETAAKIGDTVSVGQVIARIDEVGAGDSLGGSGFNAAQVKQASLAVEQARNSYLLAEKSYRDLSASTERDLAQARIARDQALQGKTNLNLTAAESVKSAELALATAQAAVEQARITLDNRRVLAGQSADDVRTNARTAADGAISTADTAIVAINNITGLDDTIYLSLPYETNLGVLDSAAMPRAIGSYAAAKSLADKYRLRDFAAIEDKLDAAVELVTAAKKLADDAKYLLDRSVTSLALPQSSSGGATSLSSLQSQVSGYQSQLSATLAQVNGAKQGLANTDLGNDATLQSLTQAYEIAQKQADNAEQALASLRAANKSQADNASFGVNSTDNQYENARIKLDTQLAVARTQLAVAELAYRNAQVGLESVYDSRLAVSPIKGKISKKLVSQGDSVVPGQLLYVVSEPGSIKLTFFIDRDNVGILKEGQPVTISYNGDAPAKGRITSISLSADEATKRFQIEVAPDSTDSGLFTLGTVMNITIELKKDAAGAGTVILPISAVDIAQNATTIYIVKDGRASRVQVKTIRVEGEAVELDTGLRPDDLIIVRGGKLIKEGDPVEWTGGEEKN